MEQPVGVAFVIERPSKGFGGVVRLLGIGIEFQIISNVEI
jgi:hypothetical protein